VNQVVVTSSDPMAQHCGDYFYLEFMDTVKHIFKDVFVGIMKEQCTDHNERK